MYDVMADIGNDEKSFKKMHYNNAENRKKVQITKIFLLYFENLVSLQARR